MGGTLKVMIRPTPHPQWINELLDEIEPYRRKIVNSKIFKDMGSGSLTMKRFRGGLINFYPLIESFPKYMALNLAKVPAGDSRWSRKARYWLITNINQERLHTGWWKQWAIGFGVSPHAFKEETYPPPEMDAINNYLWRVCTHGSLAEGMSAANFAIEGATGEWTKTVNGNLKTYCGAEGVEINEKTLEWVTAHASYDDKHPDEALEIIKAYATTRGEQARVKQATKRALEYYLIALDACYEIFT
jgi:pyrroloquinoline quinone (PQQ) biosynthesis protein C